MNDTIRDNYHTRLASASEDVRFLLRIRPTVETLARVLSETANVNLAGLSVWVYVSSREDLQAALAFAPKWTKASGVESSVDYLAQVDGIDFRLIAQQAAIPPTCHLVEEEVEVPAVPAKKIKVARVVCNKPQAAEEPFAVVPEGGADITLDQDVP